MTDTDRRTFLQTTAGAAAAFAFQPDLGALASPSGSGDHAPLKIGLIGAGKQGRAILGELQKMEGPTVKHVCDTSDRRVRAGLRRARGAEGSADYRKVLDDAETQAIIVATPTHLHRQIAIDALAAGKNVYCEAPLASSHEDALAIARAAGDSKRVFHTGMHARSNPIYGLARSFFRSGATRDLINLRAQDHQKTTWRVPSSDAARERELNWRLDHEVSLGLAGELGTHQFDTFHWFLGRYPTRVRGHGEVRLHDDGRQVADTASCEFVFDDGARLAWDATLCNSFEGRYELFNGSMASIKLAWTAGWMFKEADAPTQGWEVYANRESFHNDEGITLIADATKLAKQGKLKDGIGLPYPPLHYALKDFLNSTTTGQPAVCSAEEGLRATVVGLAAHEAVTSGTEVTIDPAKFEVR